ncbi:hypothetical protein KCU65_g323, partial [Aureobasidium melanogenum]
MIRRKGQAEADYLLSPLPYMAEEDSNIEKEKEHNTFIKNVVTTIRPLCHLCGTMETVFLKQAAEDAGKSRRRADVLKSELCVSIIALVTVYGIWEAENPKLLCQFKDQETIVLDNPTHRVSMVVVEHP